ncbi:glycosyltransferase family 4 protein [Microbacterium sp. CFBP9034]|uniref:glycosyltransferase family 4 protein n=1 Tax=Microbacterium sp. CFBP9034 TaxID=3096540 RepID=UPI002A6B262C|nr:glycosyltransferase family 4 protein [Microbacterium sp. CFBP9034]MDY0910168.1 glycosyltransferase family 4 protein [Microbacterium sp. CFBP9034]
MSTVPISPADRPSRRQESPLRIGMIAPPWFAIPPEGYGGTEAVVASLVDQLVDRGHEVTLVAAGAPGTRATRHITTYPDPPSELLGASPMPEVIHAAQAAQAIDDLDLDLVHDHSLAGPLLARGRDIPTLATMHGPAAGDNGDYFARLERTVDLVSISHAQRTDAPQLNWVGTVHNAVDLDSFPFQADKERHVLWMGRFCADKGAHIAIEAARRAGRRIILAGKLNEQAERDYFDDAVRPLLGPDAEYVGEADAALKRELYAAASCLVFPISWDEPFGMVMVEAMACGTPVVATRRGSVPEVIEHGRTGIIVDAFEDLPAAIAGADELDPHACRERVAQHFDLPVMGAGYERVYRQVLERRRRRPDAEQAVA